MKKMRVGIAGVGFIGLAHLDALRRLPEVEIVAICGLEAELTRTQAQQWDIPQWYTDVGAMLANARLDVLHNCTPNASHDMVNCAAIEAGVHVYAEKPLSDTAADAYRMWRLAEEKGIVHGLNHQYRMNPAVQEMHARVQNGSVGDVFLVSGRYHQESGLRATDYSWRMTEAGMSYALSDIGIHWVDTARCVVGRRIEKVFASIRTVHPQRTKPDGTRITVQTDDLSCVLMAFEGGAQGMMTVSKVSAGHQNDLVLGIDGQEYSMYWEQESPNRLEIGYKRRPNEILLVEPEVMDPSVCDLVTLPGGHPLGFNDALLASLRSYYAAVRGEIAQSAMRCATFEDGFYGMAFVEAAMESQRTGTWATVDYMGM